MKQFKIGIHIKKIFRVVTVVVPCLMCTTEFVTCFVVVICHIETVNKYRHILSPKL